MTSRLRKLLFVNTNLTHIFLKNTFWLTLAEGLSKGFKFLLIPLAARILGPEQFGTYGYTVTLIGTCYIITDFGISYITIREYQHDTPLRRSIISSAILLKGVFITLCTLIAWWVYTRLHNPLVIYIFPIVVGTTVLEHIKRIGYMLADAELKTEFRAMAMMIETATTTAIGIYWLISTPSLAKFAWAYLGGTACACIIIALGVYRFIPKLSTATREASVHILRLATPFLLTTFLTAGLQYTDTLMIQWMLGSRDVGHQNAAVRAIQVGAIMAYIIQSVLYPIFSKRSKHMGELAVAIRKGIGATSMIASTLIMGAVIAKPLFLLIFGTAYAPAIPTFLILMGGLFLDFFLPLCNNALLVINKHRINAIISAAAIVINILLNLVLIPKIGIAGAATATFIAKAFDVTITAYWLKHNLRPYSLWNPAILTHLISATCAAAVMAFCLHTISTYLILIIGFTLYPILLYLLKEPELYPRIQRLLKQGFN